MPEPYFFFRPILAADRSWAAIDWQSRSPFTTESADLARCFSESTAAPLADIFPMVAPLNPAAMEQNSFFDRFDARQVVFVLPATSLENSQTLARCKYLRTQGNRFGLHIDHGELLRKVPVAAFDSLWLDATFARQELSANDLSYTKDAGFHKIATSVASYEMFSWLTEKKFDWSDSHFLATQNPLYAKEPDLTRFKLLRLLNLVRQDGDTREIEGIFREEPKLSYNLLRLVNSVAVGARTKISNFSQAIAILGRRQLQRWLQLLIYANNLADGNAPNPLMQLAAARGRQMELLSAAIVPQPDIPDLCDNAFMIGLFSLLEVLINLPMKDVLKELPLHDEVVDALLSGGQGGVLGQLLAAIITSEAGNFSGAETILSGLGISPAMHAKSQITALYWASRININNHD
ncbi:HDOD domain-containing protein [Propionivibrio sp.]|uniref:EAL and HDOD domain-containing protein n=1 Tax=Propionivibrio sp. TaxID=2212460 RepID=UPI002614FB4C|nr:HDOD domain-containing protein [Propionivibrio sp.]